MPITTGFNHVATLTTDIDRTVEFYRQAFDADVTFEMAKTDDHPRMVILDLGGGAALNVFEVAADEIIGDRRRQGGSWRDRSLRPRRRLDGHARDGPRAAGDGGRRRGR